VPHPAAGTLYLRLRDDPDTINQLSSAGETKAEASAPAAADKPARP
jgi:hypothetical protein